jgi:hypothetical protein
MCFRSFFIAYSCTLGYIGWNVSSLCSLSLAGQYVGCTHRKYGDRSPKFIWAPCAQLYSLPETPQPTPLSHAYVPEIIYPVFAKTSPKRSSCMTENERFGLDFVKTGSINSDNGLIYEGAIGQPR